MEEYLNGNQAVTPQTFIQHVPFKIKKDGRIDGMSLTNDKGELKVKSQAFKSSGKTTKEGLPIYKKEYVGDTDEPVRNGAMFLCGFCDFSVRVRTADRTLESILSHDPLDFLAVHYSFLRVEEVHNDGTGTFRHPFTGHCFQNAIAPF